jgi:hypothetical protein
MAEAIWLKKLGAARGFYFAFLGTCKQIPLYLGAELEIEKILRTR